MFRKKILSSIGAVILAVSMLSGCSSSKTAYVTPKNISTITVAENSIYSTADSESGSVDVYYSDGTWVTLANGEVYIIQQYMAPKNKNDSLEKEVSSIPFYSAEDITYKAIDSASQTVYKLEPETVYTDIAQSLGTNDFQVFIEWSKDGYYYSYVMQYGDVSILYTYTDEACLFRSYVAYLESETPIDAAGDSEANSSTNTETTTEAAGNSEANSSTTTETTTEAVTTAATVEELEHDGLTPSESTSSDSETNTESTDVTTVNETTTE